MRGTLVLTTLLVMLSMVNCGGRSELEEVLRAFDLYDQYAEEGDAELASAQYEELEKLAPGHFAAVFPSCEPAGVRRPTSTNEAVEHCKNGEELGQDEDWRGSIAEFDRALELNERLAGAFWGRGLAHAFLGEHRTAEPDFTATIDLLPDSAIAYLQRGASRWALADFDGAISDSSRAIELDVINWPAYINRGSAKLRLGQLRAAITDFEKAIKVNPDEELAYTRRAETYAKLGFTSKARADVAKAFQLKSDRPDTYYARARVRLRSDKAAAIADLEQALSIYGEPTPGWPPIEVLYRAEIQRFLGNVTHD